MGPYCSTKAAIDMFSKQLAVELAPHKINVNVVASGTITHRHQHPGCTRVPSPPTSRCARPCSRAIPWGAIGEPEDIGRAVAFLASDAARYITGAVLYVDGGYTAEGTPRVTSGEQVP